MNYLSICSGIEAASVAWHPLGWKPLAFSEIEPFPSAVLAHHWPDVPNLGDMTKFNQWPDMQPNLIVGGTPCQSFSVAGLRKGLKDPRGNLTLTFLGIVDKYKPEWVVWENVPGVLSDKTKALDSFLDGLEEIGYYVAGADVLDAQWFGVAQRRRRVFVVARTIESLMQMKTHSCKLTVIQCLTEILHHTLIVLLDQLNQGSESLGSKSGFHLNLLSKKMRLFGLQNCKEEQVLMLAKKLEGPHQLSECEQKEWGLEHGSAHAKTFVATKSKIAEKELTGSIEENQSTEPLLNSILAGFLQVANECITLTASNQTIESRIFICAKMMPFITRFILNSTPSCENFWSAASSALITIQEYTKYARQSNEDIFGWANRIHGWNAFAKQAEQASIAISNIGVCSFGKILSIGNSLQGNPPPSREAGKGVTYDVAPCLAASDRGFERTGDTRVQDCLVPEIASCRGTGSDPELMAALCATDAAKWGSNQRVSEGKAVVTTQYGAIAGSLTARHDSSPCADRGQNVVAFSCKDQRADAGEIAPTLRSMSADQSHANGGGQVAIAFMADDYKTGSFGEVNKSAPLTTSADRSRSAPLVATPYVVRRLTPTECERLQGFPDGHTLIPWRNKPADQCPDGPRYKALGNSFAVPVIKWIGERINKIEKM